MLDASRKEWYPFCASPGVSLDKEISYDTELKLFNQARVPAAPQHAAGVHARTTSLRRRTDRCARYLRAQCLIYLNLDLYVVSLLTAHIYISLEARL